MSNHLSYDQRQRLRSELCQYNNAELTFMNRLIDLRNISKEIKHAGDNLNSRCPIFPEQWTTAKKIIAEFIKGNRVVLLNSPLQSGKFAIKMALLSLSIDKLELDLETAYLITGYSSTDWIDQAKRRVPEKFRKNIYHRDSLKYIDQDIRKNSLILIDEAHVAARPGQALEKLFVNNNLHNEQFLIDNNIRIVFVSATPNGLISDISQYNNHAIINGIAGKGYIGPKELLDMGHVFQCFDLKNANEEQMNHLSKFIRKFGNKYHIFRTDERGEAKLKEKFGDYRFVKYDQNHKMDIFERFKSAPEILTFVIVKEMLRASVTIPKKHIGVMFDRHTVWDPDNGAVVQSLIGRMSGYDYNGTSVIYADIESIKRYHKVNETDFEHGKWKSLTNHIGCEGLLNDPGMTFLKVVIPTI